MEESRIRSINWPEGGRKEEILSFVCCSDTGKSKGAKHLGKEELCPHSADKSKHSLTLLASKLIWHEFNQIVACWHIEQLWSNITIIWSLALFPSPTKKNICFFSCLMWQVTHQCITNFSACHFVPSRLCTGDLWELFHQKNKKKTTTKENHWMLEFVGLIKTMRL